MLYLKMCVWIQGQKDTKFWMNSKSRNRVIHMNLKKALTFTNPFILLDKLTPKMVGTFLNSNEEKAPTEWRK